jgi:hypothetical protein
MPCRWLFLNGPWFLSQHQPLQNNPFQERLACYDGRVGHGVAGASLVPSVAVAARMQHVAAQSRDVAAAELNVHKRTHLRSIADLVTASALDRRLARLRSLTEHLVLLQNAPEAVMQSLSAPAARPGARIPLAAEHHQYTTTAEDPSGAILTLFLLFVLPSPSFLSCVLCCFARDLVAAVDAMVRLCRANNLKERFDWLESVSSAQPQALASGQLLSTSVARLAEIERCYCAIRALALA